MPRRTHPAVRAKHPRAHTRHHRERVIATRTRRLRDERIVRALDNRHNPGWREQPVPLPAIWDLTGRLHAQLTTDSALTLPHHGGLADRLAYRDTTKDPGMLPCGCCWRPVTDRSGQPPAADAITEQLRHLDPPARTVTGPFSGTPRRKEHRAHERRLRRRTLEEHVARRVRDPHSELRLLCDTLGPEDAFDRTVCRTALWRDAAPDERDRALSAFIAAIDAETDVTDQPSTGADRPSR